MDRETWDKTHTSGSGDPDTEKERNFRKAHRREQVHMEMGKDSYLRNRTAKPGAARKEIFGKDLRKAALIREAQEVKPR